TLRSDSKSTAYGPAALKTLGKPLMAIALQCGPEGVSEARNARLPFVTSACSPGLHPVRETFNRVFDPHCFHGFAMSTNDVDDRREYYRIEDTIALEFSLLSGAEAQAGDTLHDPSPLFNLLSDLHLMDFESQHLLRHISERDR